MTNSACFPQLTKTLQGYPNGTLQGYFAMSGVGKSTFRKSISGKIISETTGCTYSYQGFALFTDGSYIINAFNEDNLAKKLDKDEQKELTDHILELHNVVVGCFTNTD